MSGWSLTKTKLILAMALCLFPSLAWGQGRYENIFLKTLPAGGVAFYTGTAQVCLGTGLTVTSSSVTSNVATLITSSSPLAAGFINGRDVLLINFPGGSNLNGSYTMTQVTSTQIQFSITHADAGSLGAGGAVMKPGLAGTACAPSTLVYSDYGMTAPLNNGSGFSDDGIGNVKFFAAPGTYWLSYAATAASPYLAQITIPPQVVYSTPSASTNASITATTMATAGSNGGTYRFSLYIDQTAAGTSCSGTTTITPNLTFTDANASSGFPGGLSNALISGNGAPGQISGTLGAQWTTIFRAKASTVIQYSVTYTAGTNCAPGPSYQIYPTLEQLQ